jgi:hypothetical protein
MESSWQAKRAAKTRKGPGPYAKSAASPLSLRSVRRVRTVSERKPWHANGEKIKGASDLEAFGFLRFEAKLD